MAFNFPASPNAGDTATGPNGIDYVWTGSAWLGIGGDAPVTVSATPPASPAIGDLWWDDGVTGALYVWHGEAWVEASPPVSAPTQGGVQAAYALFANDAQQVVLPDWLPLVPDTVAGNVVIEGGGLRFSVDGDMIVDLQATVLHNWGSSVVFGYRLDGGAIEELGRVKVESATPVTVFSRRQVVLPPAALVEFFISSDFEWSSFSWSGVEFQLIQGA